VAKKYDMPSTYDGFPLDKIHGCTVAYKTNNKKTLCSWCAGSLGNIAKDEESPMLVVDHLLIHEFDFKPTCCMCNRKIG